MQDGVRKIKLKDKFHYFQQLTSIKVKNYKKNVIFLYENYFGTIFSLTFAASKCLD